MGMTITEKILAQHASKKNASPGEILTAKVDFAFGNDVTAPLACDEFEKIGVGKVFDKNKVGLIADHFTPNKDIKTAQQVKKMRDFSKKYGIKHFYEPGCVGIEHVFWPEQGLVRPGMVVVGADSHTCTYGGIGAFATGIGSTELAGVWATGECWFKVPQSLLFKFNGKTGKHVMGKDLILYTIGQIGVDGALYKAMEFTGNAVKALSVDSRLSMCNMAIEAGGKNGIIAADEKTKQWVRSKTKQGFKTFSSDKDAEYEQVFEYDASKIEPQVAVPDLPENAKPVTEVAETPIDQVVIGSCTNGRIEDLRIAAAIMKNKKTNKNTRTIILPGTPQVSLQALKEGLVETFLKAGCVFSTPTCGPCLGGHMGILAEGETALSTTNRNFVGRMGHPKSRVYLCNPAVAAASALKGKIVDPRKK